MFFDAVLPPGLASSGVPKPNFELKPFDAALLRGRTEACCVLINGAAEQADVGRLVQVLASFEVDQSLDSKLAAVKNNVPNFKPSSSEVASVLVPQPRS